MPSSTNTDRLEVVASAVYVGMVGFGYVFRCQIRRVLVGAIDDPTIQLTVLAGDTELFNQISAFDDTAAEFTITFQRGKDHEPYQMMPLSGFVDSAGTSWQVSAVGVLADSDAPAR